MMSDKAHNKINYLELPAKDLAATKAFFNAVFGWHFIDYGADYSAFSQAEAGLDGGFYRAELKSSAAQGAGLIVFYSANLESTQAQIETGGGEISHPIFSFPGGRRFHFIEPSGNEFAVWSDQ